MRSLSGAAVVVTRAPEQSGELRRLLEERGASVHEVPVLAFAPVRGEELARLDAALARLGDYDGVILTSRNAVAFWHERLHELGRSATPRTFAIGPATAKALVERGYPTPIVAEEALSEGLLATIRGALGALDGRRFLLPRAREGRDVLVKGLEESGAYVDVVTLYETRALLEGPAPPPRYDWVTFASPSAVRAFVQRFGAPSARAACIGPVTAEAARALGLTGAVVAAEHTAAGLVAAIEAHRGG